MNYHAHHVQKDQDRQCESHATTIEAETYECLRQKTEFGQQTPLKTELSLLELFQNVCLDVIQ